MAGRLIRFEISGKKPTKSPRTRKIGWIDLKDERVQTLLRMEREKRTRQEISDALEVSRMWVYKAVAQLKKVYGKEIFVSDKQIWTAKGAAVKLGVETSVINKICTDGDVSACKRGKREWLIDEDGMVQLRSHPAITGSRECMICGNSFPMDSHCKISLCSPKCQREYNKRQMKKMRTQEPTLDNTSGWVHDVLKALKARQPPKTEELLTIKEAAERSGLKVHQVSWLRQRSILTRFDHPTRKHGGNPVASCAAVEVEIAGRIYKQAADGKEH